MDKLDFRENIKFSYCFNHNPCYEDNYNYTPTGNLIYANDNQFKFIEKDLKFISANRAIFELVIKSKNIEPYRIHCYDKMQIYCAGKRRSMPINSFIFRELLGIKDNKYETAAFKILINNGIRIDQLLFSEKEI